MLPYLRAKELNSTGHRSIFGISAKEPALIEDRFVDYFERTRKYADERLLEIQTAELSKLKRGAHPDTDPNFYWDIPQMLRPPGILKEEAYRSRLNEALATKVALYGVAPLLTLYCLSRVIKKLRKAS